MIKTTVKIMIINLGTTWLCRLRIEKDKEKYFNCKFEIADSILYENNLKRSKRLFKCITYRSITYEINKKKNACSLIVGAS